MTSSMPELADASSYQPGRQIERERERKRDHEGGREGRKKGGRESTENLESPHQNMPSCVCGPFMFKNICLEPN